GRAYGDWSGGWSSDGRGLGAGLPREQQRQRDADRVAADRRCDRAAQTGLRRHVPDDREDESDRAHLRPPERQVPRLPQRVTLEVAGAVRPERPGDLLPRALGEQRALDRQHDEGSDPDLDPAGIPRPQVGRHVGAGAEEAEDRNRKNAADLRRDATPGCRVRERTCSAELEGADGENGGRAGANQQRDQVYVEHDVVGVQKSLPRTLTPAP